VPPTVRYFGTSVSLVGRPGVVSGEPGLIRIAAKTNYGFLVENVYFTDSSGYSNWLGWYVVRESNQGGVCIDNKGCWTWLDDSYPALSSWGPGRTELFINARRGDGAIGLLHTWQDNGEWSDHWELLGTGLMQGSPAAVSYAYGRTDVFVRGGGNELAHKWFANGRWSGWENLGGYQTASPTVTSSPSLPPNLPASGHMDVFIRGGDGALWHSHFNSGSRSQWADWHSLGGYIAEATSPTAASRSFYLVDVFVLGPALALFQNSFNEFYGWSGYTERDRFVQDPAALAWFPLPGQEEPTPTPTPRPPRPTPTPVACIQNCHQEP
jgi:hypothetical protein